MCIYNEHNLLCNSSDLLDIVSSSTTMINDLKSVYEPIVIDYKYTSVIFTNI